MRQKYERMERDRERERQRERERERERKMQKENGGKSRVYISIKFIKHKTPPA